MNSLLSWTKELIVGGWIQLNHTLEAPLRVIGKALYMILLGIACSYINALKVSRWSKGSLVPLNISRVGILNLGGRGTPITV